VIGFVDVLGVRQEVVSPLDGVLRELDVEPGQAVEYGQPLGRVESSA
jgi:biotin carboxyl carrier protein